MRETSLTLEPETLAACAASIDDPGPLFPYTVHSGGAGPECDAEVLDALQTMAQADAAAWVQLAGASAALAYGAWFAPGDPAVALKIAGDRVTVEAPPQGEFVAALAADVLGGSTMRAVELNMMLSPLAAVIFGVAFDEARRDVQLALAMERPPATRGLSPTDALSLLDRATERRAGVFGMICEAQERVDGTPTADEVIAAIRELAGSGLFVREGERIVPNPTLGAFAARCFAATTRVELSRAWTTAGAVERAGMHAMQFGVHDVLVVEHLGTATRIGTESAADLVELIGAFLALRTSP